jgi:hypothetical protein
MARTLADSFHPVCRWNFNRIGNFSFRGLMVVLACRLLR